MHRTWAEIDLDRLRRNIAVFTEKLSGGCQLMAIIKADAYGHGDEYVLRELTDSGVSWLGVSNIEEAVHLRRYGANQDILILGYTPPAMAASLAEHRITQAVFSREYAEALSDECVRTGVTVDIHFKIDTGMTRIGFVASDAGIRDELKDCIALPGLHPTGVFTHFAAADEEKGVSYTRLQFDRFMAVCSMLEEMGCRPLIRHCCNSAGILSYPGMHLDLARLGISLYGLYPSDEMRSRTQLYPVMQLKTVISLVKRVPKGCPISYGCTFTPDRDITVATVPIGYADGYSRLLSNRGEMLLHGRRVRIAGRVCMDQLMLDVTGIDAKAGDIVTVFGEDDGAFLPVDELAGICGTINYELVCAVSKRVPRVYKKDGRIVGVSNYFDLVTPAQD